jgi:hypothetical protein
MAEQESTVPAAEPDYPRGITFEQVWAAIMEDRKEIEQRRKENDRIIQKMQEEGDRIMKDLTLQMPVFWRFSAEKCALSLKFGIAGPTCSLLIPPCFSGFKRSF